jgi:uncharacterized coiled-coil protein SlyX
LHLIDYKKIISEQAKTITELTVLVKGLTKETAKLQQELESLKKGALPKKNSSNSSIPPSKDENRPKRTQSQRTKGKGKVGGQKGHKGSKLNMVSNPDQ